MKAGRITAKLRDAVHVSFMVGEDEMAWYKNIEIPDALKELEIKDFAFNVRSDGKIEFILQFEAGVLPKHFPPKRERKNRVARTDTKGASAPDSKENAEAIKK